MSKRNPQEIFAEYMEALNSMELKDQDLYAQYSFMKSSASLLADRIDEVSAMIKEDMESKGEEKKIFDYGGFTIVKKKTWEFAPEFKAKMKELEDEVKTTIKVNQEAEIVEGRATEVTKSHLLFK